ncbi:hypothetical protein [Streptomyces sp. MST-110588]|uniref:SCO2584 family spore wall biosynthesis protein n=1 Tax=Streptomyces sp. MST-110588 TaxID=2833628 RepID=UPI001F5C6D24|nr:hypothetical protein [Streptomyces sp. MST-110588]UNO42029.1 hypothetical protein KGS77_24020 [Streptomyces sp. MST-110588]
MPDDVGGKPFPDGQEPDEHDQGSHGEADVGPSSPLDRASSMDRASPVDRVEDVFASVVFDEDFVRAAPVHEPTAVERMLAAAQARAEAEAARSRSGYGPDAKEPEDTDGPDDLARHAFGPVPDELRGVGPGEEYEQYREYGVHSPYGLYGGALRPYRGGPRWHRPVAWVLAVLMGIGLVALAFAAVYRGTSGRTQSPAPPPSTSGVDGARTVHPGALPSVSADSHPPAASAVPRVN